MKTNRVAVFVVLALVMAGCSQAPVKVAAPETDRTIFQIQESAKKIEASLAKLVELESSNRNGGILMVIPKTGTMAKEITISWNGALQPALDIIAKAIGYRIEYTGIEPATPLTVVINANTQPVYTVLESIAWQVSPNVQLVIDPLENMFTVAYTNSSYQRSSL